MAVIVNIFVSVTLVLTNRSILAWPGLQVPSAAVGLTALHYVATWLVSRVVRDVEATTCARKIGIAQALIIVVAGTTSVNLSNLILQSTTVDFHQLVRVLTVPFGALLDYYVFDYPISILRLLLIGVVCTTATVSLREISVNACSWFLAILFIITYLTNPAVIRQVCRSGGIGSATIVHCIIPYSSLFAVTNVIVHEAYRSGPNLFSRVAHDISHVWQFVPLVVLNCVLAVSVQFSSSWLMRTTLPMTYAVVGQLKTMLTLVSAKVLISMSSNENITQVSVSQVLTLISSALLAITSVIEHDKCNKSKR